MVPRLDLAGLIPEARPVVERAAAVYLERTSPWFIGLVAHGSAVKGGVIPGCSDVDLQLYLEDAAFAGRSVLPLEIALAIHRELDGIDLGPFRYLQCYAQRGTLPDGYVGPVPGAYVLLAGRLPVPEATAGELRRSAARSLAELDTSPAFLMGGLLGPGGGRLARNLRLLCTKVWPALLQVLTLMHKDEDAAGLWCLPKERALRRLPEGTVLCHHARSFYAAVQAYYPAESSVELAQAMIRHGIGFLEAARAWWEQAGVEERRQGASKLAAKGESTTLGGPGCGG
jgi:hypothetical protein